MNTSPLYLVRLQVRLQRLLELGKRHQLRVAQVDNGYLVHCALGHLFGEAAPQPFHLEGQLGNSRDLSILGYSVMGRDDLKDRAMAVADPTTFEAVDWGSLAAKPLPEKWRPGHRFGFRSRVCPVVRVDREGPNQRKGAEVDAFLARCWAAGARSVPVDREAAYREWFSAQVARHGGAEIKAVTVHGYKLDRLLRRTQGEVRQSRRLVRPEAVISGVLEVTDGELFGRLLRRGVGRHRAFGFGMLLLQAAGC